MRALSELRRGKKLISLAIVITHGDQASVLGPGETQPVVLDADTATRVLQAALEQPGEIEALDRLRELIVSARTARDMDGENDHLAGCLNRGLFARHYLEHRVPRRADWQEAQEHGARIRDRRGVQLIDALGFIRSQGPNGTQLLAAGSKSTRAVAVLLDRGESWDAASDRFELSPVAFGLREAAEREAPWLIVIADDRVRLYSGKPGVGVGHQGQVDTYFQLDLTVAGDDQIGLLPLVFSAEALAAGGSAQELLDGSANYSTELGSRLRERIYEHVVPALARNVANQLPALGIPLDDAGLQRAYGAALRVLFRLLFQAYAEDRELLPAGRNDRYDANSLKSFVKREKHTDPHDFGPAFTIWSDLTQVWDVIEQGDRRWQVPAYSGGLFSKDATKNPDGALIDRLKVPDSVLGPALQALMLDTDPDGIFGPVDFSSMSVREFGTIYEGLLESSLSVAETDMTVDAKGAWVPVRRDEAGATTDPVLAAAGAVYFHSASGERKATGSYFTPAIIVDHLVSRSVRPAVDRHLERIAELLDSGRANEAGAKFFDVRVADLAMGSGHFLVAAIDEIEARMRDFLTRRPIPGVQEELRRLAAKANEALGDDEVAKREVEDVGLLRRQVARRCVYGLDINPLSVELARLALWIHTFVPGLPLSSLDHTLACANSLTGIGTVDEALNVLIPNRAKMKVSSFVDGFVEEALERGSRLLQDAAAIHEADRSEIAQAAELMERAVAATDSVKRLFDAAVAVRTGEMTPEMLISPEQIEEFAHRPEAAQAAAQLQPAHMPVLFPEVFLRDNPGFDALVGNPPWEKLHVEEHQWWGLRIPRLRGMPEKKRKEALALFRRERADLEILYAHDVETTAKIRQVIAAGPFPGIGAAHIDLYQAFAWRNWHLVRNGGRVALVVPRGALSGAGLKVWRQTVLAEGAFVDVIFASNTGGWMFEGVDGRYTVGLTVVERGPKHVARFAGPIFAEAELATATASLAEIPADEFLAMSAGAAFPLLPDEAAGEIFRQMRRHPGFAEASELSEFRPIQGDLNATAGKAYFELDTDEARGRIPVYAGASFNLWSPDFGAPYAYARPDVLRPHLAEKLARATQQQRSAYSGLRFDEDELPLDRARIVFRDVTNRTNRRTVIVALAPPGASAIHKAPVLVRRQGDERAEAYLLGIMSSIPFDWYMRRWVELTMSFELLNAAPIPTYNPTHPHVARIVEISGRLAAVDERYAEWAAEVGVPVGSVQTDAEKDDLIAELDALVALRYGLSAAQLEHIFRTFHRGWDLSERLAHVLAHFGRWEARA